MASLRWYLGGWRWYNWLFVGCYAVLGLWVDVWASCLAHGP
jgi:hypothetical protein